MTKSEYIDAIKPIKANITRPISAHIFQDHRTNSKRLKAPARYVTADGITSLLDVSRKTVGVWQHNGVIIPRYTFHNVKGKPRLHLFLADDLKQIVSLRSDDYEGYYIDYGAVFAYWQGVASQLV